MIVRLNEAKKIRPGATKKAMQVVIAGRLSTNQSDSTRGRRG